MRIVLVAPRYLPRLGGVENHVAALATRFVRDGHTVTVATQQDADPLPPEELLDGVRVRRFASSRGLLGHGVAPGLWRWLRDGADDADVIHVHNLHALTTLPALAVAPRPMVFTPHYLGRGEGRLLPAAHAVFDRAVAGPLHRAAHVIATTQWEAEEFARDLHYRGRGSVIPNGVDAAAIRAAEPCGVGPEPLIVTAGRLVPYKQHARVVAALPHLPGYRLAVLGAGPEAGPLRALADGLGVAEQVRFTGRLEADEVHGWFRGADVVASLSRRECFGLTLAEGLAAGAAVVASNLGAHRDVIALAPAAPATLVDVDAGPIEIAAAVLGSGRRPAGPPPQFLGWDEIALSVLDVYRTVTDGSRHQPT